MRLSEDIALSPPLMAETGLVDQGGENKRGHCVVTFDPPDFICCAMFSGIYDDLHVVPGNSHADILKILF